MPPAGKVLAIHPRHALRLELSHRRCTRTLHANPAPISPPRKAQAILLMDPSTRRRALGQLVAKDRVAVVLATPDHHAKADLIMAMEPPRRGVVLHEMEGEARAASLTRLVKKNELVATLKEMSAEEAAGMVVGLPSQERGAYLRAAQTKACMRHVDSDWTLTSARSLEGKKPPDGWDDRCRSEVSAATGVPREGPDPRPPTSEP